MLSSLLASGCSANNSDTDTDNSTELQENNLHSNTNIADDTTPKDTFEVDTGLPSPEDTGEYK
ncbi:MAG: hypothetical protein ACXWDO_04195 [Bacteroidia bacterium]